MTRLIEILISMAIVAVLFVLVGVFLPSSRTITEKVETNRRQSIVFDTLNSVHRFDEWNPVALRDPAIRLTHSGPESGVGARLVEAAVEAARTADVDGVLLVGTPWFARFGFAPAPQIVFPGPVDPKRIWWLALDGTAPPAGGVAVRA